VNAEGYVCVWAPRHPAATSQGYVLEHRLVMERVLGRPLERRETVRHRDGNRQNNDPENLLVLPSGAMYGRKAKPRKPREMADCEGAVVRQIRAMGRHIAEEGFDATELEVLRLWQEELTAARTAAVRGLQARGFSDTEIARGLGISQQAVSKQWKRKNEGNDGERARG
jgi:hypothetical protein